MANYIINTFSIFTLEPIGHLKVRGNQISVE